MLIVCCLISVALLFVGIELNKHSPTISSWLVNISASLVIVAITIGLIEHIKNGQLSKELRPARIQALTDVGMELGSSAMRVYDLIDSSYRDPLISKHKSNPNESMAEQFYRVVLDVLEELNKSKTKDFLSKSKISEKKYVDISNRIDDLQQSIERIRRKYDYGLDCHFNDEFLRLSRTIKPASTLYNLTIILLPSESRTIDKHGVDALSSLITNLVSARETIKRLDAEVIGKK